MSNDNLPRVISFEEISEGDTIESSYSDGTKLSFIATRKGWTVDDWSSPTGDFVITKPGTPGLDPERVIRLLDRPEPPKPALPTEAGAVVLMDGEPWSRGANRWWNLDFTRCLTQAEMAEVDWTLAKIVPADDPTAPKTDDGLRERVEALAEGFRSTPRRALPGRLCDQRAQRRSRRDERRRMTAVRNTRASALAAVAAVVLTLAVLAVICWRLP